jgi:hypothetical protein
MLLKKIYRHFITTSLHSSGVLIKWKVNNTDNFLRLSQQDYVKPFYSTTYYWIVSHNFAVTTFQQLVNRISLGSNHSEQIKIITTF